MLDAQPVLSPLLYRISFPPPPGANPRMAQTSDLEYKILANPCMSDPFKNLLKTPRTAKEVGERLLEFFTAFVMLWIGWHVFLWATKLLGNFIK